MDLRYLKSFCKIVESGSFSKAAADLLLTQPAITAQMKELEEELKIQLFKRADRRKVLTEAGKIFYQYAKKILNTFERAKQEIYSVYESYQEELRIATGVYIGESVMVNFLGSFHEIYPEVKISLEILDTEEIVERVLNHKLDFGIIGANITSKDLESERFMSEELVLIVNESHKWAKKEFITLDELKKKDFIVREEGSGTRLTIKRLLAEVGIKEEELKIKMSLGSDKAVQQAVAEGFGVAIISKSSLVQTNKIKEVKIKDLPLHKEHFLIYHKRRQKTRFFKVFLQFLRLELRSCLP